MKPRNKQKLQKEEIKNGPEKVGLELQPYSNFVVYQTESGKVNIDVFFYDKTVWLTQKKNGGII